MLVYLVLLTVILDFGYGQNISCRHTPKGHVVTFEEEGRVRNPCPNMLIAGECGKGKWSVTLTKDKTFRFAYKENIIVMADGETVEHPEVKVEIVKNNAHITVPETESEGRLCGSCNAQNYVDVLCMQTFEVPQETNDVQ